MKEITYKIKDLKQVASFVLEHSESKKIAFSGKMGAGKTTLIKEIVAQISSEKHSNSPTFSIVNEYRDTAQNPIYHFDFYRIDTIEEVFNIGIEDYFESPYFCFMEWAEKVENILPLPLTIVSIQINLDLSRSLTLKTIMK